jgi:hypothetical protein
MGLRLGSTHLLMMFSRTGLNRVILEGSSLASSSYESVKIVLAVRSLNVSFIDGDHTYKGEKADYQMYHPLVRQGGLTAFRDGIDDY